MPTRVSVFEGDDAAPEAIRPVVDLLETSTDGIEFAPAPVADHRDELERGSLPDALRAEIEDADTVLFGAASSTHLPVLGYLRWQYGGGTYANVRPIRGIRGADSPLERSGDIDYVIVRENLSGLYAGLEGPLADLRPALDRVDSLDGGAVDDESEGAFAIRIHERDALERLAAFTCRLARDRPDGPTQVTCATKSNVLPRTDGLFESVVEDAVAGYETVEYRHLHADDVAQRLVTNPGEFSVIVTPNFAGDVLSDLGAGTIGGLGLAPSGCYGKDRAFFEPVHGTAPDIAGDHVINPTATLRSAAMMLDYLGHEATAAEIRNAVEAVYAAGTTLTPDQGGSATTEEFVDAVGDRL